MRRAYKANAAGGAPSAIEASSVGYPSEGDLSAGVDATVPGPYWFHMITEAVVTVIEQAELTPDDTPTQFRDALAALFSVPASSQPSPGDMKVSAASSAPDGWLPCDGRALTRAGDYAALYAAIGTVFGAPSETTFNIPDMRGRFAVGDDSNRSIGDTGGAETVTLTSGQVPSHTHTGPSHRHGRGTLSVANAGAHTHPVNFYHEDNATGSYIGDAPQQGTLSSVNTGSAGSHTHALSGETADAGAGNTGSAGGNQPHDNMPPYVAVRWLIKY